VRTVSQKSQYALRAIYELAQATGQTPVPATAIARAQLIPHRYLEQILRDLRRQGVVRSYRGVRGGYVLVRNPAELTVGAIVRIFEGCGRLVSCQPCGGERSCALQSHCAFADLWKRCDGLLDGLLDGTTFADLLDRQPQEVPAHREEDLVGAA
jgi:Rrf2 family protein